MERQLQFEIATQPDDVTCGPTCLHSVYRYFGIPSELPQVIREIPTLDGGGTLGVFLGCHALARGLSAILFTYNLVIFDPTWFALQPADMRARLVAQAEAKANPKLRRATKKYVEFLDRGGEIRLRDLSGKMLRKYLDRGTPILTGLSATYLYRTAREYGPNDDFDDVRGEPAGHFVVLVGYDREKRHVLVADPHGPNPIAETQIYPVVIDRLVASILLGIVTYDANMLVVEPRK